jgi:serine/threonine protein kinase
MAAATGGVPLAAQNCPPGGYDGRASMSLPAGSRLGPYEIVAPLGAGGMGEVYRARDTRLDRDVAVKILPESLASDPDRLMRFEREAKALASLNHPNIAQIYGVEDRALVMELVEGEDLAARIARGAIAVDEALPIAQQIADALAAAPEKGIVHRDLKPANVMLTAGGRVKVLDFGLATRVAADSSAAETKLGTQTGVVLGTIPYMSPEQVQGLAVDPRTDLFSFGILLHELLCGARPFRGDNEAALMSAILRDDPPATSTGSGPLPESLGALIRHCLKKRPADRPASAVLVGRQLQAIASGMSGATRERPPAVKTVVVLPFANRSGDPDNEYFSDGLTEEVIADLSRIGALRTISRSSSMTLKGTTKDTATLARELGVSHLVTGSVRRAGKALRVTAELVDARTDAPIWSDKYSGTVEDVFGIQEEIARKIVAALQVTLTDSESRQVAERPIADTVAYDCYLRARQEMYGWTPESADRAHRLVDEALAIVGDVPLLLATKGQLHWSDVNTNRVPADVGLGRAADVTSRALAIDPHLPLAIYVRGLVAALGGRPESALPDLYRAHELAPNDTNILTEVCRFSNAAGLRHHEALVKRAGELDPLTAITPLVFTTFYWVTGRRDEIAPFVRRAVALAPAPTMLHIIAGWQMAAAGCHEEARDILGRTGDTLAGTVFGSWASFQERALERDEPGAMQHGAALEGALLNEYAAVMMAEGYARLGRGDDALRWVRRAIARGFLNYPFWNEHSQDLAPLRDDAEYQALLSDVKPRWEGLVAWEQAREASHARPA